MNAGLQVKSPNLRSGYRLEGKVNMGADRVAGNCYKIGAQAVLQTRVVACPGDGYAQYFTVSCGVIRVDSAVSVAFVHSLMSLRTQAQWKGIRPAWEQPF